MKKEPLGTEPPGARRSWGCTQSPSSVARQERPGSGRGEGGVCSAGEALTLWRGWGSGRGSAPGAGEVGAEGRTFPVGCVRKETRVFPLRSGDSELSFRDFLGIMGKCRQCGYGNFFLSPRWDYGIISVFCCVIFERTF